MCRFAPSTLPTPRLTDALARTLNNLPTTIEGNRRFLDVLRNESTFFDESARRDRNLMVIDYADITLPPDRRRNVYEVTEEFFVHNAQARTARTSSS